MRSIPLFAAVTALAALAACGPGPASGQYEKADGTFDREAYRAVMDETCQAGVAASTRPPTAEAGARFCSCVSDRILRQTDAELRAEIRDRALDDARQLEAFQHCAPAAPPGPGLDPATGSIEDSELEPPPEVAAEGEEPAPGAVPARPRTALANYISQDDYPAAALRNGEQGRVGVSLEIGPDGRVANCIVTDSSGSASLDSTTCRILRSRARYTPARDAGGAVTTGRDQAAVRWALPSG